MPSTPWRTEALYRSPPKKELANDITYVAVHISDTGNGISEEMIPIVFKPFHLTEKIGHGTGLGLAISRKIAEEHGGFIQIKNGKEKGLAVSMFFPYQSDEELGDVPCWEDIKIQEYESGMKHSILLSELLGKVLRKWRGPYNH